MSNSPYYYQPDNAPRSKRSSGGGGGSNKTLKIVLILLGVLMFLCVGAGVAVVVGTRYMVAQGAAMIARGVIDTSPEAKEALGEVQSASINNDATVQRGDGGLVIDVHGTKTDARLIINNQNGSGALEMSDGKSIPLTVPTK